jgi:hypothetical protein
MKPLVITHKKLYNILTVLILFIVLMIELTSCANPGNMKKNTTTDTSQDHGQTALITAADLEQLPSPVASWLKRSGVVGKPHVQQVWLSQQSVMRMSPEKERWNRAISEQVFDAGDPSFTWQVKMKMGPVSIIRGKDVFENGNGTMNIRLFGLIPVVSESGPKIDEGSIQRFLGEIAWFPQAALKPYIKWEQIDMHSAKAVIESHGTRGEGTFYFNSEGDFVRFSALRYKGNDAGAQRKEWVIDATAYATFSGIRVPSELQATWKLEEGDWTWLKMEIKDVKYFAAGQ